jgi:hypothetical protein
MMELTLSVLPNTYAVCRLSPDAAIPAWSSASSFYTITRTPEELSILCKAELVPLEVKAERDWRALKVEGPLDFSMTGVIASLSAPLAEAFISIFVLSTYDTDYVLVRSKSLSDAISVFKRAGFAVNT